MFALGRQPQRQLTERERRRRTHRPRPDRRSSSVTPPPSNSRPPPPPPPPSRGATSAQYILIFTNGNTLRVTRHIDPPPKQIWKSFQNLPRWNIVPMHAYEYKQNYFLMSFDANSFSDYFVRCTCKFVPFKKTTSKLFESRWLDMRKETEQKYYLNQRLRWAFKRLLNLWLTKRLQFKNTTDFVTLEAPKQEVVLYDWAQRSKYKFEASSILGDFRTRLLSHEELFPMPMGFRNPFTNTRLTYGQIHSVYTQLKQHGRNHWTLECFRDARYELYYFTRDNQRKLRLMALKHLLETAECRYILLDFIETQHNALNKHCDINLYDWALNSARAATLKRIQSWKEMCYKFYEIDITTEDPDEKLNKQGVLSRQYEPLCTPCEELKMVRQMVRNKRREA